MILELKAPRVHGFDACNAMQRCCCALRTRDSAAGRSRRHRQRGNKQERWGLVQSADHGGGRRHLGGEDSVETTRTSARRSPFAFRRAGDIDAACKISPRSRGRVLAIGSRVRRRRGAPRPPSRGSPTGRARVRFLAAKGARATRRERTWDGTARPAKAHPGRGRPPVDSASPARSLSPYLPMTHRCRDKPGRRSGQTTASSFDERSWEVQYVISRRPTSSGKQVTMPVGAGHCSCLPSASSPSRRGRLVPTEKPGGPRESSVRGQGRPRRG